LKALLASGDRSFVRFGDVPEPQPKPGELIIEVGAFSVNRGELRRLIGATIGWRPGWDVAGRVVSTGFDVADYSAGDSVFGMAAGGAWAERVAVDANRVVGIPPGLSLASAAALPVAGLTAVRTLRLAGSIDGRRVLVTGASGGVGRIILQLAHLGRAEVTAVLGKRGTAAALRALGADEVIADLDDVSSDFHVVLESVGGASFERSVDLVAPRGVVVSFGISEAPLASFNVGNFYRKQARIHGYFLPDDVIERPPAQDLGYLATLVTTRTLRMELPFVARWTETTRALAALADRSIEGKAVLLVGDDVVG
jgi:NADPH2:quinone reductase